MLAGLAAVWPVIVFVILRTRLSERAAFVVIAALSVFEAILVLFPVYELQIWPIAFIFAIPASLINGVIGTVILFHSEHERKWVYFLGVLIFLCAWPFWAFFVPNLLSTTLLD